MYLSRYELDRLQISCRLLRNFIEANAPNLPRYYDGNLLAAVVNDSNAQLPSSSRRRWLCRQGYPMADAQKQRPIEYVPKVYRIFGGDEWSRNDSLR